MKVMEAKTRGRRKTNQGVVISNKMEKTVVVRVERRYRHSRYEKILTRAKKYYAHDETNALQEGDVVIISETRPVSKLKRWRVVEKVTTEGQQ